MTAEQNSCNSDQFSGGFFLDIDGPNGQSMAAVIGRQDYLYQSILQRVEILSKQCLFKLKRRQKQKHQQCANCAKPTVVWVLEARQEYTSTTTLVKVRTVFRKFLL